MEALRLDGDIDTACIANDDARAKRCHRHADSGFAGRPNTRFEPDLAAAVSGNTPDRITVHRVHVEERVQTRHLRGYPSARVSRTVGSLSGAPGDEESDGPRAAPVVHAQDSGRRFSFEGNTLFGSTEPGYGTAAPDGNRTASRNRLGRLDGTPVQELFMRNRPGAREVAIPAIDRGPVRLGLDSESPPRPARAEETSSESSGAASGRPPSN